MKKNGQFIRYVIFILAFILLHSQLYAGGKWYNFYDQGLDLMKTGKWTQAIGKFREALKIKSEDAQRIRTYGMHFIEYYPHRETGICFYELGQYEKARVQLQISLRQSYSARAMDYLQRIKDGTTTPKVDQPKPKLQDKPEEEKEQTPVEPPVKPEIVTPQPPTSSKKVKLVGERMGIAVLPFQTSGLGVDIGNINVVEQMMTTFYNTNRFKILERTQLERILEEQSLGMSGVLDASTAAEIGKGVGVDAIVLGNVTRAGNNLSIDARLIDTESAEIITAQDELSRGLTIPQVKTAIQSLAQKISADLPLLEGYVIGVSGSDLTLDLGSSKGLKKGMKCIIYMEGEDIIHPLTKKILGKQTTELGEIKLQQVYSNFSVGKVIKSDSGMFEVGNKFVTK